jgi:TetR/AcrR family transcriptional regulator, cholesterol catabolism regulator
MSLREEKKAEMRRQLYDTAMALFRERGYDATRVRDVIDQVRVSEATFFNYFPSKEAVLQAAALETKQLYTLLLRHLLARSDEPLVDRLHELVRTIGVGFAAHRDFMATVVTRTNVFFGASGEGAAKDHENFELLAELFRQGQARGEVKPELEPLQLAETLTAIYLLTITNWITGWWGERGDLEARLATAVGIFIEGCGVA